MYRSALSAIALAAAALTAAPALAGGVAEPVVVAPAPMPTPAPASDWTGFYVGAELGVMLNGQDRGFGTDSDFDGTVIGLFGGYRYDFGTIVAGVELDYFHGSGDFEAVAPPGPSVDADYTYHRIGVEVGYDAGPALISVGAGHMSFGVDIPLGDFRDSGYYYGLGVDYRVSDRITVGAELNHNVLNDFEVNNNDLSFTSVGLNVAFTF